MIGFQEYSNKKNLWHLEINYKIFYFYKNRISCSKDKHKSIFTIKELFEYIAREFFDLGKEQKINEIKEMLEIKEHKHI